MEERGILIKSREQKKEAGSPVTTYRMSKQDIMERYGDQGKRPESSPDILLNMQNWRDTHTKAIDGGKDV